MWALLLAVFIIGDSTSAPDPLVAWPERAFVDATNLAVAGAETQSYAFTDWWIIDAGPGQTWWVMLGINDVNANVDPNITLENLDIIFDRLVAEGVTDISLMIPAYRQDVFGSDQSAFRAAQDNLATGYFMLCTVKLYLHCPVDLRPELFFPEHYRFDGVHFSAEGYQRVADLVVPEPSLELMLYAGVLTLVGLRRGTA